MSLVSVSGSREKQQSRSRTSEASVPSSLGVPACGPDRLVEFKKEGSFVKGIYAVLQEPARNGGEGVTIPVGFALRLPPQQRPQTTPAQWDPVVPRLGTMPFFSPRTPQPGRMPGTVKLMAIGDCLKTDMPRNLQANAQDPTATPAVW